MDNFEKDEYIKKLEKENIALKKKIDGLYKSWNYDSQKYTELKHLLRNMKKD